MIAVLQKFKDYMVHGSANSYDRDDYYEEEDEREGWEYDYYDKEETPIKGFERKETRESGGQPRDIYGFEYMGKTKPVSVKNNVIEFNGAYSDTQSAVLIAFPTSICEADTISDYIRSNKACIVNLEGIEKAKALRVTDFLCGSVYALGGDIQRISDDIYIVAPASFKVAGVDKNDFTPPSYAFKKAANFR
ncbi:MAG: cell division protein SepF [Defluviitaleaceae bacterium]|nr:cell division protein SepF [Defluviitaleaceae bacterium]